MLKDSPAAPDPIQKFLTWYAQAEAGGGQEGSRGSAVPGLGLLRRALSRVFPASHLFRPDVATLATIARDDRPSARSILNLGALGRVLVGDPDNRPSARSILYKGLVEGGFSFYTDYESDKGRELDLNPSAVMVFYWSLPPRQVRIDGRVRKLSREDAKRYWESRTRANQVAAAAVKQSSVIGGREALVAKAANVERTYSGRPIPCPDNWGGYSLVPEKIEFWEGKRDWLHDRERYVLSKGSWTRVTLAP